MGWKEIIKNIVLFKLPIVGAKQEFLALSRMQSLGIKGPKIKSYYSRGINPSNRSSFLITEELKDTISLEDFFLEGKHKDLSFLKKINLLMLSLKSLGNYIKAELTIGIYTFVISI